MAKPILTYDIKATPTPVQVGQGVTISLVVSNATPGYVSLSEIRFQLPGQGTNATDLSANQSQVPTSSDQSGWTITQSGSTFSITPNTTASGTVTPGRIGGQGLVFNFGPIPVNDTPGTATLTLREDTGAGLSDPQTFAVSKWPDTFDLSNFRASQSSVTPGATVQLGWTLKGAATLSLAYNGLNISNPPNPFTSQGLATTTTFTLTANSSINGAPVTVALQSTVEVETPRILSLYARFGIVYRGQGETLHWTTQQTDSCILKANGVVIDGNAPISTGPAGYAIDARNMQPTTTFELDASQGRQTTLQQYTSFAKSLLLRAPMPSQAGWGQVAVDQSGLTAYVCNARTNALDIVRIADGTVTASVPVGLGPRGVSVSADGATAYVSNAFDGTISIVDLASYAATGTIAVPSPAGSAILGTTIFVASTEAAGGKVRTIDLESGTISGTIAVGGRPFDVAVTPDGQTLYVANNAGTTVDIFDIATAGKTGSIDIGVAPTTVAGSGNGASVYAGSRSGTEIVVIDAHAAKPVITATVAAYTSPAAIGVSGSGQYVTVLGPTALNLFELSLPTVQMRAALEAEAEAEATATP